MKTLGLFSLLLLTSCIPLMKMESGRTLNIGESSIELIGSSYSFIENSTNSTLPYMEFKIKHGLSENFEITGGLNIIGFFIVDGKYQVFGNKTSLFAMSIGLGGDFLLITPKNEFSIERNLKLSVPFYCSFHPNDKLYLFVNPQFSKQITFDENEKDINFLGMTSGIGVFTKIGELNFGGSYFKPLNSLDGRIIQAGISYKFKF